MKRCAALVVLLLSFTLAAGGGYLGLGYQSNGGLEFGGGGYGQTGRLLFGGEGHGGLAGYGYGLGYLGYRAWRGRVAGLALAVIPRLALGGGGGRGWAGPLVEGGVWLAFNRGGFPAALYLAYQYAPGHAGVLLRLDLGGPTP